MDVNLLKEIHYLTRLIEQHKKKSLQDAQQTKKIFLNQNMNAGKLEKCMGVPDKPQVLLKTVERDTCSNMYINPSSTLNVHVNPNFKPQNCVIHINPKVQVKPLIHVNPKLMKDVTVSEKNLSATANISSKDNQIDTKRSVYVNPNLMKNLSSTREPKQEQCKQVSTQETNRPICSRLKLVKSTNTPKTTSRRLSNSSVVILSQRKLVRIRRVSKGSTNTSPVGTTKLKKTIVSPFKKTKTPLKVIRIPKATDILQSTCLVKPQTVKPKINKYRIDRTVTQVVKVKQQIGSTSKKILNNATELITIGGILYKSSKNQLVRKSYSMKKKRILNVKNDNFIVATNGKRLHRLRSAKETQSIRATAATPRVMNGVKLLTNISPKINHKTSISNKVKQRSIQILRNKMRKNNQPCLIFQRFGYCANHQNGTCSKLHDKKQVSLCKKFLQGHCLLNNCPLSHDVGPEKMPTCKYFLEGCCTRDACPYRHVKVSSDTPICIEFLKGYCAMGHKCKRRHENICPDFHKTEKCSKGKYCPYPHKSQSQPSKPTVRQSDKYLKKKDEVRNNGTEVIAVVKDNSSSICENRLRYYEQPDTLIEDMDKKREQIMRKVKIMKGVNVAIEKQRNALIETFAVTGNASISETCSDKNELEIVSETKVPKRPPIGSLPAYIPIN